MSIEMICNEIAQKIPQLGVNIVQEAGDSETAVMSQRAVTDKLNALDDVVFEVFEKKEAGENEIHLITELTIEDFARRGETSRGETALIKVTPNCEYILSFDGCIEHTGAASLYLSEYSETNEIITEDVRILFERLGTTKDPDGGLEASVFPNGGSATLVTSENTRYIKLMFDAYLGAPERLPSGLKLEQEKPGSKYFLNDEQTKALKIGVEQLNGIKIVSNNLFDKTTATTGETVYLGKSTKGKELYGWYCQGAVDAVATEASSTGFDSTSTAIEVEGGGEYFKSYLTIINFFDENDVWINHPQFSFGETSIIAPDNAKYARLSFISDDLNKVQFVRGNKAVPYDEYRLGTDILETKQYPQVSEMLARNALNAAYMQGYMEEIAEEAHKYTAPNRHTFLFVADTHASHMSNRIMSLAANMTKYVPCSYIAHGGDIVNGLSPKENELRLLTTLVRNGNEAKCPVYYVKGNHDWNLLYVTNNSASTDEYILNSEIAKRTNCFNKSGVVGNNDEMYFYVDDEWTKVRTIFLNGFNEGKRGDVSELKGTAQVYTREQLEWLANEALNFSDKSDRAEWGVIAIAHQMINSNIAPIFVNFKNGTSQNVLVTENDESFDVAIDFTTQGAMEVIAIFVGDNHYDALASVSSSHRITEIVILNASLANDYADGHYPSLDSALLPPNKVFGTENETAFDIVTVDRENRLIYLTRYGARSYVKNDETGVYDKIAARTRIIDYSTASYVVREE